MSSKSEKSEFSILGLSHKFFKAFEKAGGTPADANKLAESPGMMSDMVAVLRGNARVECIKHIIDCDAEPMIPEGWSIHPEDQIASSVTGQLEFDPSKIKLYLCDEQKHGSIEGNELRLKLEGKPVLNACVLDHLLANTKLIPESWKADEQGRIRYIYFWGTIYRNSDGNLCVRCLYWRESYWDWNDDWLGSEFDDQGPAAVLAS